MQGRRAQFGRLAARNVPTSDPVRLPTVGHVIDHQHPSSAHRDTQRLHQPCTAVALCPGGIVNDPHTGERHDVQRIGQQAGRHIPAAGDGHDQVRCKTGTTNGKGQLSYQPNHVRPADQFTMQDLLHFRKLALSHLIFS